MPVSLRNASLAWAILVVPMMLALGGCFLMSWSPTRPKEAAPVSGPAVYVEGCLGCHAARVGEQYARSLHTAKGIRCGQCHTPGGHPNFTQPVADAKCGGCHQPQYQQTLASATGRGFVGDASSGELGGRLCATCHYDEHPMGGCALGGNARRDVVDSRGRSWDVDGLYVADSSIFPTSLGVNPCYTVYALGRYIAHHIVDEIRA